MHLRCRANILQVVDTCDTCPLYHARWNKNEDACLKVTPTRLLTRNYASTTIPWPADGKFTASVTRRLRVAQAGQIHTNHLVLVISGSSVVRPRHNPTSPEPTTPPKAIGQWNGDNEGVGQEGRRPTGKKNGEYGSEDEGGRVGEREEIDKGYGSGSNR